MGTSCSTEGCALTMSDLDDSITTTTTTTHLAAFDACRQPAAVLHMPMEDRCSEAEVGGTDRRRCLRAATGSEGMFHGFFPDRDEYLGEEDRRIATARVGNNHHPHQRTVVGESTAGAEVDAAAISTHRTSSNASHPVMVSGADRDDTAALRLMLPGSNNVSAFEETADDGAHRLTQHRCSGTTSAHYATTGISTPTPSRRGRHHRGYPSPMNAPSKPQPLTQTRNPLTAPSSDASSSPSAAFEPKWTNRAFANKLTSTTRSNQFASVVLSSPNNLPAQRRPGQQNSLHAQQLEEEAQEPVTRRFVGVLSSGSSDGLLSPVCSGLLQSSTSTSSSSESAHPNTRGVQSRRLPIRLTLATFAARF